MKIYVAADHAGFNLKEKIKKYVTDLGYDVEDCGANKFEEGDDYPRYMHDAALAVAKDEGSRGILFGGSGQGEAIEANKHKTVRAAVYYGGSLDIVKLSRQHNDANILSIGARFVDENDIHNVIKIWLETPFSGEERHKRRIQEIEDFAS